MLRKIILALHHACEAVAAGLLAIIFVAFIIQIALRYIFNWPIGWTAELSVIAWLWLVLWGAAFVLKDEEEIRFDLISANSDRRTRVIMGFIGSVSMIILLGMSLPAAYSYVSFMKVEKSAYMKIPFDWLFSIYLVFSVAAIGRHLCSLVLLLRGKDPMSKDLTQVSSAL
ncbi:MAG: TRAP transporter small permease subunit [Burkholderiaceae bacterium]